ncbi:MAG: hypothetical protein RBT75_06395 [Anaerolineae bacterium]|jgi:beta-lactamase superfamily II metal-dependent hydrolase|nr:hypothetical protein [Anaerolineae bacterium]
MFNLHVLQARYGDSLLLEYGTDAAPRYTLIDGGPKGVYAKTLRRVLETLPAPQSTLDLDLVVLSHIDEDHVQGLLDLYEDLGYQRLHAQDRRIHIQELWHNAFNEVVGADVAGRLARMLDRAGITRSSASLTARATRSIEQGEQLTEFNRRLNVPRNLSVMPAQFVALEQGANPVHLDNLTLHIVGPTAQSLAALRTAWLTWLEEQERRLLAGATPSQSVARGLDTSIPNLSSIMLLAEADGKRILLTGDGRSDDLTRGLEQAGILAPGGTLHVDILKLPHHGSKRNITAAFLRRVTADTYVVSASGYHGHPALDTLKWIVTAAHEHRPITIAATNETSAIRKLLETYDPATYGYRLELLPAGQRKLVLTP